MVIHPFSEEDVLAFAAGELDAERAERIRSHVELCNRCHELVSAYREVCDLVWRDAFRPVPDVIIARALRVHRKPLRARVWSLALHHRGAVAALAVVLLLVALVLGRPALVAAAEDSLPGEALYPLKSALEGAQLALAPDPAGRIELELTFADRRERELQSLVAQGRLTGLPPVSAALEAELEDAEQMLGGMAQPDPERAAVLTARLDDALTRHVQVLSALLATLPSGAQPAVQHALDVSQKEEQDVHDRRQNTNPPPGQVRTPPGQALTPPGQALTPPGQGGTPPGQGGTPPGQAITPPGQALTPPGQAITPPGQAQTPPGQQRPPAGQPQTPAARQPTPPGRARTPTPQNAPPGQARTPAAPNKGR